MRKALALFLLFISSTVIMGNSFNHLNVSAMGDSVGEKWPEIKFIPHYKEIVEKSLELYRQQGRNYNVALQEYSPVGDYLNYGQWKKFRETENLTFDDQGVPKVRYGDDFHYNPVTIAQYALAQYGNYILNGDEGAKYRFLTAVDKLLTLQDEEGALRYTFPWKYYLTGEVFEPGWVSGMAQGQALSALSRAYYVTRDPRYLEAGNKALEFMIRPVEEGGTMSTLEDLDPSLKDYIFFEEYISTPNNYTLNGFMFALLGLYDWQALSEKYHKQRDNVAKHYFELGIKTLINVLPYYDIGGFSSYDLGHLTFNKAPHVGVGYHAVHIYLLHALHSVTGEKWLQHFETVWRYYVE